MDEVHELMNHIYFEYNFELKIAHRKKISGYKKYNFQIVNIFQPKVKTE